MTFRQIVQTPGYQVELGVSYTDNGTTHTFNNDDIVKIRQYFNANITGSIMQCAEIELFEKIPDGKVVDVSIQVSYGTDTATKTFTYRVKDSTYEADSKIYVHNVCDFLLDWMVAYEPLSNVSYPCTIQTFFEKLCQIMGYTTTITLPNRYQTIESDIYDGIGMSYRDVLDDICSANGIRVEKSSMAIVKRDLGTTPFTIDDDVLMNQNITLNEHYGPVNVITMNRTGFDSAYYPSTLPQTIHDYVIQDNQMLNGDDRLDYAPGIFGELENLEFDTYDLSLSSIGGFEPLEQITISTDGKTFNGYVFNGEVVWEGGNCSDTIYTQYPQFASTEYQYATADKQQDREAKIIVDKLNQELSLEGKTINLTADDINITSTNFSVDENGNMVCNNATINGTIKKTLSGQYYDENIAIGNPNNTGNCIEVTNTAGFKSFINPGNFVTYDNNKITTMVGYGYTIQANNPNGNAIFKADGYTDTTTIKKLSCDSITGNCILKGTISLRGDQNTYQSFGSTLNNAPIVILSPVHDGDNIAYVGNIAACDKWGFSAFRSGGGSTAITFNWIAIQ